jgi:hypothetical protein
MTVTTYAGWVADGKPWKTAKPVDNFSDTLRSHGYTVYNLGDQSHATADPPEDHMPYSHTPWPDPQPYPYVFAADVMPDDDLPSLASLAERIIKDKNAKDPGLAWLKYMNYTDAAGNIWHVSWMPNFQRTSSTDGGHIHISGRTDFVTTDLHYDPVSALVEEFFMALSDAQQKDMLFTLMNAINPDDKTDGRTPFHVWTSYINKQLSTIIANQKAAAGTDYVNEDEIVKGVLSGLGSRPVEEIATALKAVIPVDQLPALIAALQR